MREVDRLIAAGIRPDCAVDTVLWYKQQGDAHKLEEYVREAEIRHEKAKERAL